MDAPILFRQMPAEWLALRKGQVDYSALFNTEYGNYVQILSGHEAILSEDNRDAESLAEAKRLTFGFYSLLFSKNYEAYPESWGSFVNPLRTIKTLLNSHLEALVRRINPSFVVRNIISAPEGIRLVIGEKKEVALLKPLVAECFALPKPGNKSHKKKHRDKLLQIWNP